MRKSGTAMMAAAALAAATIGAAGAAAQDIGVLGVRVGVDDVAAAGDFYAEAFGLKEVNRFGGDMPFEIIMNFGDTVEAAQASSAAQVVLMSRAEFAGEDGAEPMGDDPMPHLIFTVSDAEAVVAQAEAAGASVQQAPTAFGDTGVYVAMLVDPQGNHIELLQFPAPPAAE